MPIFQVYAPPRRGQCFLTSTMFSWNGWDIIASDIFFQMFIHEYMWFSCIYFYSQYSKCMLRPVGVNVSSHRLCFHEMAEISSHRIYFFKCSYMNICDFHAYTSIFIFYVMCRFSYSKWRHLEYIPPNFEVMRWNINHIPSHDLEKSIFHLRGR